MKDLLKKESSGWSISSVRSSTSRRMKLSIIVCAIATAICLISITQGNLYAQPEENTSTNISGTNSINMMVVEGKSLTLEDLIKQVLKNNLSSRSGRYDAIMSDSDYLRYQSAYAPRLNAGASFTNILSNYNASLSLSENLPTGTSISVGVMDVYTSNQLMSMLMPGSKADNPYYHTFAGFITIQQQLLNNSFGYRERLQMEILKNSKEAQRAAAERNLANIVMSAIIDSWNLSIQKSSVRNSELELSSEKEVRDIISRNVRYGLGESFDLNQYNAAVASAESKLASATQNYNQAFRSLQRTLNLQENKSIEGELELRDDLPEMDTNDIIQKAFSKRVDYNNLLIALDSAKKQVVLYQNDSLPSLSLGISLLTMGTNSGLGSAMSDAMRFTNLGWGMGLNLSYPLGDPSSEINMRNSKLRLQQAENDITQKKMEIRDEILDDIGQIQTAHLSLSKSRFARSESEEFYNKMLGKFRQGKINATTLKTGFDSLITARQQELNTLIQYNIALLQLDVAKNELFEKYDVDIEKYLSETKE